MIRLPLLAAGSLLLGACATRTAGVEQRLILPEGGKRYEMADSQAFVFPMAQGNPPPGFPDDFGARELPPTTLCAKFVVAPDGAVRDAAMLDDPGCIDPASEPKLASAVLLAVSGWRFEPAVFCNYPDAATRDRDWTGRGCAGDTVEALPVAVTLAYAFTFEVRNGRRQVGAARVGGR
ncbi:MAG: hypothetical protein J0L89_07390 [Xanthomonadales bacterium]|nr:hypothetical protein [Xanthomonadaceae bacterium]MBN8224624.1 hypothetical protein [Xanthomonadales bacterium]